jgi:hypothetical protein
VFKLPGEVVQLVPSYSSVAPVLGVLPPKAKAAVCVPAAPKSCLAVFKESRRVVQLVPLYSSVAENIIGLVYNHQKLKLQFVFHNCCC